MHGALYYRHLEKDNSQALLRSKGNFDDFISLASHAKSELHWWIQHVGNAYNNQPPTTPPPNNKRCFPYGLGDRIFRGVLRRNLSHSESKQRINYLEMLAILLGIQTFAKNKSNTHIRIMCDNTTAVNVINHMGTSHSDSCNSVGKEIWEWCKPKSI